jgi:LmbE family N-acetylglucosaminyl deacetylase
MAVLGVDDHRFLGLGDGSLASIDPEVGVTLVGELLDDVHPDTILTFGPDGITGHPDHVTISRWTTEAWHRRGHPGRLLHATMTTEHVARFGELYEEWGVYMTDERPAGVPPESLALRLVLDGTALDRKLTALAAMASQTRDVINGTDPAVYASDVAEEAFVTACGGNMT